MSLTVRSTILNVVRLISYIYLSSNLNIKFEYQIREDD